MSRVIRKLFAVPLMLIAGFAFAGPVTATPRTAAGPPYAWTSTQQYGTTTIDGYSFNNDTWNSNAGPQTIGANSANDWGVTTRQNYNGNVETYPDVFTNLGGHLNSYSSMMSSASETSPSGSGQYNEAAYDIFLNGPTNQNSGGTEVMIWTDTHNVLPSGETPIAVTIAGTAYDYYPADHNNGGQISFVQTKNTTSQTTNILAILDYLQANGGPSNPVISAVDFGWEVWGTNGITETFHCSQYNLVINGPMPVTGHNWSYPAPTGLIASHITHSGYRLAWNPVTGPQGQIPGSYTVATYKGGALVDEFTTTNTRTSEYGPGGHGLPAGTYQTVVWANDGPVAPAGDIVTVTIP